MKFKRFLTSVLVLCMIITMLPVNAFASSGISHETGYILGIANKEIKNSDIHFESRNEQLDGRDVVITCSDENVVITDNGIIAKKKGLYILKVEYGISKIEIYFIVKNEGDKEYVLYSNDFEGITDSKLPEGFENVCGNDARALVKDGKLQIKASDVKGSSYLTNVQVPGSNIVLLPKFLKDFSNVIIRANVSFDKVANQTRWMSLAYRYASSASFYHMSFRQNGSEVECTKYLGASKWQKENSVPSPYAPKEIPLNHNVNIAIGLKGDRILQYMDGYNVANVQAESMSKMGYLAFIANQCDISIDDVEVVLNEGQKVSKVEGNDGDKPIIVNNGFANVYMPKTAISTEPSTFAYINNREDFEIASGEKTPSTAVINIDTVSTEVVAVNDKGEKIASLPEIFDLLKCKIMPAFSVKDEKTALELAKILKANGIGDTFMISDDGNLLNKVYNEYFMIRGILDFTKADFSAVTDESEIMQTIMEKTNSSSTKIALIPESLASRDNIRYLQRRFMTAIVKAEKNDVASLWNLVISGCNGIMSSKWDTIIYTMETFAPNVRGANPIVTRTPFIVGHRGIPAKAPENSISGALKAVEEGADLVEIDVYLSKDRVAFLNHDYTLTRTTDCKRDVNASTMNIDEITSYRFKEVVNGSTTSNILDEHVPTAKEFFKAVKGKDLVIVCELKTSDPGIVPAIKEIIEELDMKDQVVFISFYRDLIASANKLMPWSASADLNINGSTNDSKMASNMKNLLTSTRTYNSIPDGAYNSYSLKFIKNANYRGVPILSWTYREENQLRSEFVKGHTGLTTDYSHWAKTYTTEVVAEDRRLATDETTIMMSDKEHQKTDINYRKHVRIGAKAPVTTGKIMPLLDDGVINTNKNIFNKNQTTLGFIKHTHVLGGYRYDTCSKSYTIHFDKVNPTITLKGENKEFNCEITNEETTFNVNVDEDTSKVTVSSNNMDGFELYKDKELTTSCENTINLDKKLVTVYIKANNKVYTLNIKRPIKQYVVVKTLDDEVSYEIDDEAGHKKFYIVSLFEDITTAEISVKNVSDYGLYADPYHIVTCKNVVPLNESNMAVYIKAGKSSYAIVLHRPVKEYVMRDVKDTDWFAEYVKLMSSSGIVQGDNINEEEGTATLRGNDPTSRNEAAVFILRMIGVESEIFADKEMPFIDRDSTQTWADNYVKAAYSIGLLKGEETKDGLVYRGKDKITRGEFFAVMARALMPFSNNEGYKDVTFDQFVDKEEMEELTWFEDEFKFVIYNGIANGKEDGFKPRENVLRCQVITAIARAFKNK